MRVAAGLLLAVVVVAAAAPVAAGVGRVAEGSLPLWLVLGLGSSAMPRTVYLVIQMWGGQGKELLCWADPSSSVWETLKLKGMEKGKSHVSLQ